MPNSEILHPNQCQKDALEKLCAFLDDSTFKAFILKGYAGTGKTTLVKMFIETLRKEDRDFKLLASTGRAAKILRDTTGLNATTIHSLLYSFNGFNQDLDKLADADSLDEENADPFLLTFELRPIESNESQCIYIIDEISMISDKPSVGSEQAKFGSGNLLQDIFDYDTNGKFIFIGDECQLPPITGAFSPALVKDYLEENYSISADEFTLTEVLRQSGGNDIMLAAQKVRRLYNNPPITKWGNFPLRGYKNIKILPDITCMLNAYIKLVKEKGYNAATLISHSNRKCAELAELLRPSLGFTDCRLQVGELLLVTQNNNSSALMNGDLVKVVQIGHREQRGGLTFLNVEVENIVDNKHYSQYLIENLLYSRTQINLSQSQQKKLYIDFVIRMRKKGIGSKTDKFKEMMYDDPYLNALRVTFGYAITCHKAQGGEWKMIYLDIPRRLAHEPKAETYQWLYTGMTRASDTLFIVDDFYVK